MREQGTIADETERDMWERPTERLTPKQWVEVARAQLERIKERAECG